VKTRYILDEVADNEY